MAIKRLTDSLGGNADWIWDHKLNDQIVLCARYAVYADLNNSEAQPYLRVSNFEIRTLRNDRSWLDTRLPITLTFQVDDEEKTYTVKTGDEDKIKQNTKIYNGGEIWNEDLHELCGYYYIPFSSSTNIKIPKDGTEFTLKIGLETKKASYVPVLDEEGYEVRDENGDLVFEPIYEKFSVTEHAASPIVNSITGPDKIETGVISTYTLSRGLALKGRFSHDIHYTYSFKSLGSHVAGVDGYVGPYLPASAAITEFTEFSIVPLRGGVPEGETSIVKSKYRDNKLMVSSFYDVNAERQPFTDFYKLVRYNANYPAYKLPLGVISMDVSVTSRIGVDESLRPEFLSVSRGDAGHGGYAVQMERYGAPVQGKCNYRVMVRYLTYQETYASHYLQYGSEFLVHHRTDYTHGDPVVTQIAKRSWTQEYSTELDTAVTNAPIVLESECTFGFTTSYTDYVSVIPYHAPVLTVCEAKRCSPATGDSGEVYYYDGQTYAIDDYGEYAMIRWGVDFAPLNNVNSRKLSIKGPSEDGSGAYATVTIDLPDYMCEGYYIVPANPEVSYTILYTLEDDFYGPKSINYGGSDYKAEALNFTYPLNTALAMIDFRRSGDGVALGKVSELRRYVDIHRNWVLKMPYGTWIQNYKSDGTAVNLYEWMQQCMNRMQKILESKDWGIYGYQKGKGHVWFQGYTRVLIPEDSGTIYEGGNYVCMMAVPKEATTMGITTVEPIVVNRNYLNIRFDPSYSFRGTTNGTWSNEPYKPMIYLCTERPTSIDQTTGKPNVPNSAIVDYHQITTAFTRVGSVSEGYTYWSCESGSYIMPSSGLIPFNNGTLHSFNVADYKGQELWFVITCRQGGDSQTHYYKYRSAQINLYDVMLSDRRLAI